MVSLASVFGPVLARPPRGYRKWIKSRPLLSMGNVKPAKLQMDQELWGLLHKINDIVNNSAQYKADAPGEDVWGPWRFVNGVLVGDCEDYAIHKLQALKAAGIPRGALRLAVCRLRASKVYHCVLLIMEAGKTPICLDNRTDGIWRIGSGYTLGYEWVSQEYPGRKFWWRSMK